MTPRSIVAVGIVSGTLVAKMTKRVAKNKAEYLTGFLRSGTERIGLTAFDKDVVAALAAMDKGEPLAVSGQIDLNEWTDKKTGEPRSGLRITALRLMS